MKFPGAAGAWKLKWLQRKVGAEGAKLTTVRNQKGKKGKENKKRERGKKKNAEEKTFLKHKTNHHLGQIHLSSTDQLINSGSSSEYTTEKYTTEK